MDLHIVQLHVISGYKCAAIIWEVGKILKQIKEYALDHGPGVNEKRDKRFEN